MKKRFKALALVALTAALALCLAGCAGETKEEFVYETDHMVVEGMYVNDAYVSDESDQLKLLYLFYTVKAGDSNIDAYSKMTTLTIGENEYETQHYPNQCDYMPSYYYSDYIETVYVGDELRVVETVLVPEGDLAAGKTIKLNNTRTPGIQDLALSTDDIVRCATAEEIAQAADPDGYADAAYKREAADSATTEKVKNAINGYYWSFFVNSTSYQIEFFAPNSYETRAMGTAVTGTYTVSNGYIICTNDSNGYVVEIPYTWENGDIKLDVATAYSVNEG